MGDKLFVGVQVRRARERHGLSQAALARRAGISPSYLNQIERDQRPLTVTVLLRLRDVLGVDFAEVAGDDRARLVTDVHAALSDPMLTGRDDHPGAVRELVTSYPDVARALVHWHHQAVAAHTRIEEMAVGLGARLPEGTRLPVSPYEDVLDFVYDRRNHFPALDEAAEALVEGEGLHGQAAEAGLARLLRSRHRVRVALGDDARNRRHYDAATRRLTLPRQLTSRRRAFQLAVQWAFIEHGPLLDELTDTPGLADPDSRGLARIGLANYFAGATLLPYVRFRQAAEDLAYDIDLLAERFDVGIEAVCHRLSTLQRPGHEGVPFFFVRVDRAGNISKRHSATDLHLSRVGGTCPLWNVYAAFSSPGRFITQVAQMPDGRTHLWIARTVTHRAGAYGTPPVEFALGLGCDLQHAPRLVYGRGVTPGDAASAVPIGPGCRLCERRECRQRAYPLVGRALDVDERHSREAPYPAA